MKRQEMVLVVGGSSGLGRAMVDVLLERGFAVVVVSRERRGLLDEVIHLPCDICDEESLIKTISLINNAYNNIDYLIMSVGGIREDVNDEYELNYLAPKNFINGLLGRVEHYLVVSSFSAKDPNNYRFKQGGYSWAKGCLSKWVFCLDKAGIASVTLVEPAFFETDLLKKVKDPFFPAHVGVVAERAVKAMLSKKRHSYLSWFTAILGILSPVLPKLMVQLTDFLLVQIYRLSIKTGSWGLRQFRF